MVQPPMVTQNLLGAMRVSSIQAKLVPQTSQHQTALRLLPVNLLEVVSLRGPVDRVQSWWWDSEHRTLFHSKCAKLAERSWNPEISPSRLWIQPVVSPAPLGGRNDKNRQPSAVSELLPNRKN